MHDTTLTRRHATRPPHQRGSVALPTLLVVLLLMGWLALAAHRSLLVEQRSTSHQVRAAQAFEAAEAGLEWAIAQLNRPQPIDDRCLPTDRPDDRSFRERFVPTESSSEALMPTTWRDGVRDIALAPTCVRSDGAWQCSCPSNGLPSLTVAAADSTAAPAFSVQFTAGPTPATVRLSSVGCATLGGPCQPGSGSSTQTSARVEVLLGRLPGLASTPRAAITALGDIDAIGVGTGTPGIHNPEGSSGGLTVQSGGGLNGASIRLSTAPGAAATASTATHDPVFAELDGASVYASLFGVDITTWASHPAVQTITCQGPCGAELTQAIDRVGGNRMLLITGDAHIDGPVTLGSPERPVIIVVSARARVDGGVTIHGLLHANAVDWTASASGAGGAARLEGALVSASDVRLEGAIDIHRNADTLRLLRASTGSLVRVPGSWKDF
jgi:type II secretory pathway pseudopilin PulG